MKLTHEHLQSLLDGLALLDAAPPRPQTSLSRSLRLRLQDRLLTVLGAPPLGAVEVYWRGAYSWEGAAVVACGMAVWDGGSASFAVDAHCCTLHPSDLAEVLVLAMHLGQRPQRVMPDTAA